MTGRAQAEKLWQNILALGGRRLAALGLVGLTVLLAVGGGAYYLSRPVQEALYTGLSREDVNRIGGALKDAGIAFDVSSDGTSVLVAYADTAQARMLLAEQGLPQNANSGYELFNELGSFGLTSFMQEITKVRALEGELARTIQTMKGIKAARVHIVLPDPGSFRRDQQPASASVVIRTERADDTSAAQAIRHLVAAAIPGMKVDSVTVLNTEGTVLASGDDGTNAASGKLARLQQEVSQQIEENIRRTLTPYLGLNNFEISVATRLDVASTRTSETIFDPDSRVERSVRVIRENAQSRNSSSNVPATVQQNIPQEELPTGDGADSNEQNERREELTNFEISSKVVETQNDGFAIEQLSIAVLVNRDRLMANAGTDAGSIPVDAQIVDIEQLVTSAAGLDLARGDKLKVAAVGFAQGAGDLEPTPPLSMFDLLMRQMGTLINAATMLVIAVLLILFGLRPAMKVILGRPKEEEEPLPDLLEGPETSLPTIDAATGAPISAEAQAELNLIEDLTSKMNRTPQKRLEQIIEYDEEQAAAILRQWLRLEEKV
ncbi:flagellar basal-body MS-ring/collar protein FliF [Pseudoxanthobacter sp. M-2]|uniref:flagellar basal-body MS-ring/collar protein FliF n=1 Tax=Pseudoxanthobacter sp. M-2 TaxID=3078754 RepID=UPI0038FC7395